MRKLSILLVLLLSTILNAQSIKSNGTHFVDGVTDKNGVMLMERILQKLPSLISMVLVMFFRS